MKPIQDSPPLPGQLMTLRNIALETWKRQLGTAYTWGGAGPEGFDCSGLVIEGLKSVGILPRKGDWTSRELAKKWLEVPDVAPGCLLFWNRGQSIGHVEIVAYVLREVIESGWSKGQVSTYKEQIFTIGASGGGSKTLTREDAIKHNAFVKLRPAVKGWVKCVDPFA